MDRHGFTLIELLITIAIIGILAAIAVTSYVGVIKKGSRSEAYSNLESLWLLEEQFFADTADYTADAAGVAAIQTDLPGFRPGPSPLYTYTITQNREITDNTGNTTAVPPTFGDLTPCFTATAEGLTAGTRVFGDFFAIDCNNNRNF